MIDTDDSAVASVANRLRPLLRSRSRRVARRLLMLAESPGNAMITWLDRLGMDEAMMGFTDRLRRRRGLHAAPDFEMIPGTMEMLLALRAHYRLGIVTTRSQFHIEAFLAPRPQLTGVFEASLGRQDTRRLKPHPEPVLRAAAQMGVAVERCLMVGDTTVDIKAARRAGAWSCGVLCGFGERRELERAGAHLILDSTAELAPHLLAS